MANILVDEQAIMDIADAIREKNGTETKYKPREMAEAVRDIVGTAKSFILEMPDGTEIPAVLVDHETIFTATPNDIRVGKVAATGDGVTIGEKIIPAYQTVQGFKVILPGQTMLITNLTTDDSYDYTKLQAIICLHNTSLSDSVAAEMISLEDKVYSVRSVDVISNVSKNHEDKTINLGIMNNFEVPCIVRYFTYKEV